MIKNLAFFAAFGILSAATFIILEKQAERNPTSRISKWWRKHIVSDTHKED